jgi:hypothetical protein
LTLLGFAAAGAPASAAGDRAQASRDFAEGLRLFQLGDFEGARSQFLRADAEVHAPAIVFNLARAEEKLGDPQAAIDDYEAYLREAGTSGELGLAATVAVAELRERSARLRVESIPSGAVVEIDGRVQRQRTPAVLSVRPGPHRVKLEASGLDETRIVDADRPGVEILVSAGAPPAPPSERRRWLAGVHVALVPYQFLGTPRSAFVPRFADRTNVTLGGAIEGGVPVLSRLYLGADLFGSVGTFGHPNYVAGGSLGLLYRFDVGFWLRAAAAIAAVDSNKEGRVLSTDVVLGPSIEVDYELARSEAGAWMIGAGACLLPADADHDNDALFFPVRLGWRMF